MALGYWHLTDPDSSGAPGLWIDVAKVMLMFPSQKSEDDWRIKVMLPSGGIYDLDPGYATESDCADALVSLTTDLKNAT